MAKALFLDRDGTINVDHGYVYKLDELELLTDVAKALRMFQNDGFLLIVITNQSGVGRGMFSLKDAETFNKALAAMLDKEGVQICDFFVCPHSPDEECNCRKPLPTMIFQAIEKYNIDPKYSYMLGDKRSDVECGENAGVESHLVTSEHSLLYWANRLIK